MSNLTVKTWGGPFDDYGKAVAVDSSGNSYLVGTTYSFGVGGSDVFLVAYNSSNSLVWQRTWGGRLDERGNGIASSSSGDVYVTGFSCSFTVSCDTILLKFNSSGSLMWQKSTEGFTPFPTAVANGPLGGVYVTEPLGVGKTSTIIERFDSSGNLFWARNWSGVSQAYPNGIASDSTGNVSIVGETQLISPTAYKTYAFLLHLDVFGDLLWQRIWVSKTGASSPQDSANSVAVDSIGNIYVAGRTSVSQTIDGYQATLPVTFLSKYNSTGSLSWEKLWYSTNEAVNEPTPGSIGVDSSGNIYLTGYPSSYLLKLNPDGILLAQQKIIGSETLYLASNLTSNVYIASAVSKPPQYTLCSASGALHSVNVTQVTNKFPLGILGVSPMLLTGNVTEPMASQTYAGGQDAAMISYDPQSVGSIPSCSSLAISPIIYLTTFILIAPLVIRARRKL